MTINMNVTVFLDVTPCSLVKKCQRDGERVVSILIFYPENGFQVFTALNIKTRVF
jgi:hypothetical protein